MRGMSDGADENPGCIGFVVLAAALMIASFAFSVAASVALASAIVGGL